MAGGVTTPQLVAAVANAGAVGSFGFAYSAPEKIAADMAAATALTDGPINANFFIFSEPKRPDDRTVEQAVAALNSLPVSHITPPDMPKAPFYPDLDLQLAPIWDNPPALLSFHFGLPPQSVLARAQSMGILVGCSATSLDEAMAIERLAFAFVSLSFSLLLKRLLPLVMIDACEANQNMPTKPKSLS